MRGMTGYGYAEGTDSRYQIAVELKSWNNKFADINLLLPPALAGLDEVLRSRLREKVIRGRVDVTVRFRDRQASASWSVDEAALEGAIACLELVRQRIGDTRPLDAVSLLAMEGVLRTDNQRDLAAIQEAVVPVFDLALAQFDAHRRREGQATQADLRRQIALIDAARSRVAERAGDLEQNFRDTLRRRFAEVLGDAVDEQRVLQELAVMLVRYSIHEELERLALHCSSMAELIEKGEGVAKRIDFLSQEMNREVNTIGSKSVDAGISALVVDMKEAIDVIREQVRNIE